MRLVDAFNIGPSTSLAFVGAGGKTSALFRLAREICTVGLASQRHPGSTATVFASTTTHLETMQSRFADHHIIVNRRGELDQLNSPPDGVILVTGGEIEGNRIAGLSEAMISDLGEIARQYPVPLLIESDGARRKPVKAPAEHEPAIPGWVDHVAFVAGMQAVGRELTRRTVHRLALFAAISGLPPGSTITTEALVRLLLHPHGGLKNVPADAVRSVLLNQSDTPELQAEASRMAGRLVGVYDSVIIAALRPGANLGKSKTEELNLIHSGEVYAVHRPVAGVILAAGESKRFGEPKQVLDLMGEPMVRWVARTALKAGLSQVLVVTGAYEQQVQDALNGLPVRLVHNPDWNEGQASSVRAGVQALEARTGAVVFLLADQPMVSTNLISSLREKHASTLAAVIAPVAGGKRGNPVLFDRKTFADLASLEGEFGGRAIFSRYPVMQFPWHDDEILLDVDTVPDYEELLRRTSSQDENDTEQRI